MTTDRDAVVRLEAGDRAPGFRVETLAGGMVSLEELLSGRSLVLLFMREFT